MTKSWSSRLWPPKTLSLEAMQARSSEPKKPFPVPKPRSWAIRVLCSGACGGCNLELAAVFEPPYLASRFGITVVSSPREADILAIIGPVAPGMEAAARRTLDAMPEPRRLFLVGDCPGGCGPFGPPGVPPLIEALEGFPSVMQPTIRVVGCAPSPADILRALLEADPADGG